MDINIHNVKSIKAEASSVQIDSGRRFHIQEVTIKYGDNQCTTITLYFDKASDVLPIGDRSQLDHADSTADYLGVTEKAF